MLRPSKILHRTEKIPFLAVWGGVKNFSSLPNLMVNLSHTSGQTSNPNDDRSWEFFQAFNFWVESNCGKQILVKMYSICGWAISHWWKRNRLWFRNDLHLISVAFSPLALRFMWLTFPQPLIHIRCKKISCVCLHGTGNDLWNLFFFFTCHFLSLAIPNNDALLKHFSTRQKNFFFYLEYSKGWRVSLSKIARSTKKSQNQFRLWKDESSSMGSGNMIVLFRSAAMVFRVWR